MYARAFKYSAIAALGGFIFGLDAALISGTISFLTKEFQLSDLEIGSVVSASALGVIVALIFTGYMADRWGRKKVLQWIAFTYILSAAWSTFSPDFYHLLTARFLGGLAFTSITLSTMYIGEIAPAQIRGKLVAMNQISIVVGLSTAYFINYFILKASGSEWSWVTSLGIDQHTWRWMLGAEILPAMTWFGLLFLLPRSPRWLILKSRTEEARKVLSKLLPKDEVQKEIQSIEQSIKSADRSLSIFDQFKLLFSPALRAAVWIGLTFAIVQQITGINAILFYAPTVFEQLGIGKDAAFMQAVWVGIISLVSTFLALFFIDRVGRRKMTLGGLAWAVISLGLCAYGFHQASYSLEASNIAGLEELMDVSRLEPLLGETYSSDVSFKNAIKEALGEEEFREHSSILIQKAGDLPVILILLGVLSFIASFQFSIGPIMWVVFSEIFSTKVRAVAIPTFAFVTSVVSYLVQQFFPWQLSTMGARDIFIFYALTSSVGLIILFFILPETKNQSIEEIESKLSDPKAVSTSKSQQLLPNLSKKNA